MKTFEVELRRTSFITVTVEAESEDQAEELAWADIETMCTDSWDAQWEVESIEEVKSTKGESK